MKKNFLGKLGAVILVVLFVVPLAGFLYMHTGNPVSYFLAKKNADKYMVENFADEKYDIVRFGFDFKASCYYAEYALNENDTVTVDLTMTGKVIEAPDEDVLRYHSHALIMESKLRESFEQIISEPSFPVKGLKSNINLRIAYEVNQKVVDYLNAHSDLKEIALDQLGLYLEVITDDISTENAAHIIKDIKDVLDKKDYPFRDMTLILNNMDEDGISRDYRVFLEIPREIIERDDFSQLIDGFLRH